MTLKTDTRYKAAVRYAYLQLDKQRLSTSQSFVAALDSSHVALGWPVLRQAKLKRIPLGSDNMVLLVSPHSTVGLEGNFQLWKRVKTGFYNNGKNNTFTVIKLVHLLLFITRKYAFICVN